MKKIIFTLLILLPMVASAYDFEVNGIAYDILSIQNKSVCVRKITSEGDVVIPDSVLFNNYLFGVDSIAYLATSTGTSIKFNKLIKTDGHALYACFTKYFYVDESNPYMTAVNGVLYSKDMTRIISYPTLHIFEEFSMPESVNTIDEYSFGSNKNLKKLFFSNNVEILPEYFLYGTNNGGKLKFIKLSDKITVITQNSLRGQIEEIILPRDLEVINCLPSSLTDVTIFKSQIANLKLTDSNTGYNGYAFPTLTNLINLHVKDSNPIELDSNAFSEGQYFTLNLYVPKGSKGKYQDTDGWKNFFNIFEEDTDTTVTLKCAKPTISYINGQLKFECATEGVSFVSEVTCQDVKTHYSAIVPLTARYNVCVYATKAGYEKSDIETIEIDIRGLKGDVNSDGEVNIADINSTIDIILGH